jgi:mRNA deadenylase 3'-5' endonuclease subunit Ccr4
MKWRATKVHSNVAPWLPFWRARVTSALHTHVKNIHWTEQCMVCLDRNRVQGDSVQNYVRSKTLIIQQEAIVPLGCSLKGEGPKHSVYHLRPHSDSM